MKRIFIHIYIVVFCLVTFSLNAQSYKLSFEQTFEVDYALIDIILEGSDESLVLGSANFPFEDDGNGLDWSQVEVVASDFNDVNSYQPVQYTNPGFHHVYINKAFGKSGNGTVVTGKKKVVSLKVKIADVCGNTNLKWITNRGAITSFEKELVNKKINFENAGEVTITPPVVAPIISDEDGKLVSTSADAYQWYENGVAIPGAQSSEINVENEGTYYVETSNSCSKAISNIIDYGVEENLSASPNPFVEHTEINYSVEEVGNVTVSLFNIAGELMTILYDGEQTAGNYSIELSSKDVPSSGMYLVKVELSNKVMTKRVVALGSN